MLIFDDKNKLSPIAPTAWRVAITGNHYANAARKKRLIIQVYPKKIMIQSAALQQIVSQFTRGAPLNRDRTGLSSFPVIDSQRAFIQQNIRDLLKGFIIAGNALLTKVSEVM